MRVAYNDSDDSAGLRGYVQFNKYTYIHTYIHTYILLRSGYVWVLSWLAGKIRWVSTAFTRMVTQWIGFCRLRSFSHVRVGSRKLRFYRSI